MPADFDSECSDARYFHSRILGDKCQGFVENTKFGEHFGTVTSREEQQLTWFYVELKGGGPLSLFQGV